MRLTQRDILLFKWINGHGFVTANQINKFLQIAKTTGYRRIKKLVDHGWGRNWKIHVRNPELQTSKMAEILNQLHVFHSQRQARMLTINETSQIVTSKTNSNNLE